MSNVRRREGRHHVHRVESGWPHRASLHRLRYVLQDGATLYYAGKSFQSLKGSGFKSNYFEVESGEPYWISGPRKDGQDSLYATNVAPEIDEDVRIEYWSKIRDLPAHTQSK